MAALLAIPIALRQRRHASWLFLGLIAFGVLMSVGLDGALMPLLWRWIPGFTSFRTPGRGLYFIVVGMAGLTALLVSTLQTADLEQRRELLQFAVRRGLPVAAAAAFVGAVFFSGWYASASHVEPMPLRAFLISGVLASAGLLLLGLWFIIWLWTRAEPEATRWALLLTCVFVILDAWHVGYPVITVSPLREDPLWAGARVNVPTGADARVTAPLGFENLASVTGHLNVSGYDPLPVETYRKLQALADSTDPTTPVNTLLGVKYYLATKPYDKPNFKLIGIADGGIYYQRTDAFPRAWIAQTTSVEPNDDAVRQHIMSGKEDLAATVYIDQAVNCPTAGGTVAITSYRPDDVEIHTGGAGGLLTLSDQFYPGWQATVDGQPTAIVRADTVFRAVCVPAGDHTVDFVYRPLSFFIGVGVSAAGWLIWLVLMIWWIIRRKPERR
ncbi:MAG: YfhO family protein [Aggregatilineales bacterium]